MNALFLVGESLTDFNGISKKIKAQVNALEHLGLKVILSYLEDDGKNKFTGRYNNGERIDKYSEISIISKIQARCKYKNLYRYIKKHQIELVLIRYTHFANPFFISFLKKLKKDDIKILLEIPTYPYDQEYKKVKFISKIVLLIEKLSRRQLKKYVTRVLTLTPHTTIFGIPAIEISNGIDPDSINIIENHKSDNDIHLIGVASMAHWHGYDRVIEGLHNYYRNEKINKKKVFFHIVGDSGNHESILYKKLVKKYGLSDYIIFHGRTSGKDLDIIFNNSEVAVGSLGCHRISIKNVKSLKNREYCARGLPFFYSETDAEFEDKDFIFKVPSDDSPIEINDILKFVHNNKFDKARIRKYAFENLTWEKQYKKVLTVIFPELVM